MVLDRAFFSLSQSSALFDLLFLLLFNAQTSFSLECLELSVVSFENRSTSFKHNYLVSVVKERDLVSHQNYCLLPQKPTKTLQDQLLPNLRVNCTEWVTQEVNVSIRVTGSGEGDARFLSS